MSRQEAVSAWTAEVSRRFPQLSRPQAVVLALWSLGIAVAGCCGQTSVVVVVADWLGQSESTVRQRLREWCYAASDKAGSRRGVPRRTVEVATCFAPLLGWILAWWETPTPTQRRLALALDASTLGDRFTVLALSVLYRGCAIPVAWTVVRAQEPDAWRPHWLALLARLRGSVPATWLVVVAADRGLYAPWLYQAIGALGWHPFLRLNAGPRSAGLYRRAGEGGWRPLNRLLPQVGAQWTGEVVCFVGQPVRGTLVACWEPPHAEGWVVLTDLAPTVAQAAWYGLRSWIEDGFKDIKRGGWQWQATRMTDPARVSRFWLALAVATLWVVSLGSVAEDAAPRSHLEALPATHVARRAACGRAAPRLLSCFRRGVLWLRLWIGGRRRALPRGRFRPEPWPRAPSASAPASSPLSASTRRKTYP